MPIPIIAGIAIAAVGGAAGGGAAGGIFGGAIDAERKRFDDAVEAYMAKSAELQQKYESEASISWVINKAGLSAQKGWGIDQTYLTDLTKAFRAPKRFDIYAQDEGAG